MKTNYVVWSGKVEECDNGFCFKGQKVNYKDPLTKISSVSSFHSSILFPFELSGGKMSFDVEFDNVCKNTRCGFIFNQSLVDNQSKYHQVAIQNDACFCNLAYFNGEKWDLITTIGDANNLEKQKKYTLTLKRNGNNISFFVNNVLLFTSSKLVNSTGNCGIFTFNEYDSKISNIETSLEKSKAFAIMKFEKDFNDLYRDVITVECEKFGYKCLRADECYTSSTILQDIIREISEASLVIADITMDNPNVFYELGYAHALSKPTILLADANKRDTLPFDISGYRTIFYENTIGGKKEIEERLHKYIENLLG